MQKESYEKVMVGLNFDTTMKNLADFLELREELGSKRPRLEINWLVLPENEDETESFKEYWLDRADAIEIWQPHNFGDGRDYRQRYEEIGMKTTCGRPENGPLQIQWNGEVIPCCYDYNNQIVLGNAFEHPILGRRLRECTELLNAISGRTIARIFGQTDSLKFQSCMTLFAQATTDIKIFEEALQKFYEGEQDRLTLERW